MQLFVAGTLLVGALLAGIGYLIVVIRRSSAREQAALDELSEGVIAEVLAHGDGAVDALAVADHLEVRSRQSAIEGLGLVAAGMAVGVALFLLSPLGQQVFWFAPVAAGLVALDVMRRHHREAAQIRGLLAGQVGPVVPERSRWPKLVRPLGLLALVVGGLALGWRVLDQADEAPAEACGRDVSIVVEGTMYRPDPDFGCAWTDDEGNRAPGG